MSILPGATLSMPGIAGIVLTLGMSVDANVLIFERIKEEIRNGRSIQQILMKVITVHLLLFLTQT